MSSLVRQKPVAGRVWKSLTRDEWIETRKLLWHWFASQQLCGSLGVASLHTNCATSAGSLAVILQPAFVPFVRSSGVSAVLKPVVMPVLMLCSVACVA